MIILGLSTIIIMSLLKQLMRLNVSFEDLIQPYFLVSWIFGFRNPIDNEFKKSYQYKQFKEALDLHSFNAWYYLPKVYLDLKKYDKAIHSCQESLKIDPKSKEALKLYQKVIDKKNRLNINYQSFIFCIKSD